MTKYNIIIKHKRTNICIQTQHRSNSGEHTSKHSIHKQGRKYTDDHWQPPTIEIGSCRSWRRLPTDVVRTSARRRTDGEVGLKNAPYLFHFLFVVTSGWILDTRRWNSMWTHKNKNNPATKKSYCMHQECMIFGKQMVQNKHITKSKINTF